MQQQEKVVLGVSLVVTLMAGWVQVGEASAVASAERRAQACWLIETNQSYCSGNPIADCEAIAGRFNCFGALQDASCEPIGSGTFLLRCEFFN